MQNYEFFKNAVLSLASSQGFYGRLYNRLLEIEQDIDAFDKLVSSLPKFNDVLDVVFFVEQ